MNLSELTIQTFRFFCLCMQNEKYLPLNNFHFTCLTEGLVEVEPPGDSKSAVTRLRGVRYSAREFKILSGLVPCFTAAML